MPRVFGLWQPLRRHSEQGSRNNHQINCQKAGHSEPSGLEQEPDEHEAKMFAVIKTGGKQYSVTAEDIITVMTLVGEPGETVTFSDVLMIAGDGEPKLGAPFIEGATVTGEIVEQTRGPKVISFKKRRRQNSKRKRGHRQ